MNGDSPCEPSREELIALIAAQAAKIAALEARIAELERRLGFNSSNSGKPPSSDGLSKPPRVRSLREPSDKPSGGQKGHKGDTLRQVAVPDRTVDHYPPSCATCGLTVSPTMSTGHSARRVFDLPEPASLVVTEHRAHDCRCSACGARTRAWFPDGINAPVQWNLSLSWGTCRIRSPRRSIGSWHGGTCERCLRAARSARRSRMRLVLI